MKFIYFLFTFLLSSNFVNSYNILSNSTIISSHTYNTTKVNLTNIIINDYNKKYSTGIITDSDLPIYIYFDSKSLFYNAFYEINWDTKPKSYNFYISDSCEQKDNFNYSIDGNYITIPNYNIQNCSGWKQLSSYLFSEVFIEGYPQSKAWTCNYYMCSNIDYYISSYYLLEITELNEGQSDVLINYINIDGMRTDEQINFAQSYNFPYNYQPNLEISDLYTFTSTHEKYLGNNDCSLLTNNLTNIDENNNQDDQYGYSDVSFVTGGTYSVEGDLTALDEYYLCYKHSHYSDRFFPQQNTIKIYRLTSFSPNVIQKSSVLTVNITSDYPDKQYLALTENDCQDLISEFEVNNKLGTFIDGTDVKGRYDICYSIDNDIWSNSNLYVDIVVGEIESISGCTNEGDRTIDCPTSGGTKLYIYGTDFDTIYQNTRVSVGINEALNIEVINTSLIKADLPQGTGLDLPITINFNDDIRKEDLLSYMRPNILKVYGCEDINNETINCLNSGTYQINILGDNFGTEGAKILVGTQFCEDIIYHDHTNLTCSINGNRGLKQSIFIIQYQGDISDGKPLLSYKECEPGYEFINDDCSACIPGYYKKITGDISCSRCSDNMITDNYGQVECGYCPKGYEPYNESSICSPCGNRFYKDVQSDSTCSACLENQITYNDTESQCHYCPPGYEVSDNICIKCSVGYYKKNPADMRCIICADGYYSNIEGMEECTKCPDNSGSSPNRDTCKCNTNFYNNSNVCYECDNLDNHGIELYKCNDTGIHLNKIINSPGYWRANKESLVFYECKLEEHCPEQVIKNDTITCLEYHTGILCNLCVENYAQNTDMICTSCSDADKSKVQSLTVTYFMLGIIIFILFIVSVLLSGKGWLKKIIEGVRKAGFINDLDSDLISSSRSLSNSSTLTNKSDIQINSDSDNDSDSENNSDNDNDRNSKDNSYITNKNNIVLEREYKSDNECYSEYSNGSSGELSDDSDKPVKKRSSLFSLNNKFIDFGTNVQQKFKILISYMQIITLLSQNLNIKWPKFIEDTVDGFNFVNLDILTISEHDIKCSFNTTYYNKFILYLFIIPILVFTLYLSYIIAYHIGKKYKMNLESIKDRFIYCLVLFIFIIYPSVGSSILKIYKCELIEDTWYLSEDLSLVCFNSEWTKYGIVGGVFIVIYILGIPCFFYYLLKNNLNLVTINDNEQTPESKKFAYRYGFMYMGYEPEYWWFEIVEMMKKIILLATVIYLDESGTRILIAMLMCFGYLAYISYNKPLKYDDDDYLNVLSAAELFLMLLCALVLEVKLDVDDEYNEYAFQGFMFVLLIGVVIIGNYEILKSLFGGHIKFYSILKFIGNKISENYIKLYKLLCGLKKQITSDSDESDSDNSDNSEAEGYNGENNNESESDDFEFDENADKYVTKFFNKAKDFLETTV